MDRLWAPWRIKYVSQKKRKECVFCRAVRNKGDFVVFRQKYSLCLLNIFPYNNGHVMVCPLRHTKDLSSLSPEEVLDLFQAVVKAQELLMRVLRPEGFNIGVNISHAAGAGIVGHLHIHIVPRWGGDTNFMPILTGTKVISQSLKELHRSLKRADAKRDTRFRK